MQSTPKDKLNAFSFRLNRAMPSKSKQIRLCIEKGFSIVSCQKLNFYSNLNSGWYGSNYNYSEFTYQTIGLSIKGKATFLLSRRFGKEFPAFAIVNQYQNIFVGQIGKVNDKSLQ